MTVPRARQQNSEAINQMPFLRYASAEECPDVSKHTKHPGDYRAFHEWATEKAKTHTQHRCPTCGFWSIWKRKRRPS